MRLDIALLSESFEQAIQEEGVLMRRFYELLFERYPEAKALFGRNSAEQQQKMLQETLVAAIERLEDTAWVGEQEFQAALSAPPILGVLTNRPQGPVPGRFQACLACVRRDGAWIDRSKSWEFGSDRQDILGAVPQPSTRTVSKICNRRFLNRTFSGAIQERKRTASLASRENLAARRVSREDRAVSGSLQRTAITQNPAESRVFLDDDRRVTVKSLERETQWRWGESVANSSLGAIPCYAGKIQGISRNAGIAERATARIAESIRTVGDEFPTDTNRESSRANRESVAHNRESKIPAADGRASTDCRAARLA